MQPHKILDEEICCIFVRNESGAIKKFLVNDANGDLQKFETCIGNMSNGNLLFVVAFRLETSILQKTYYLFRERRVNIPDIVQVMTIAGRVGGRFDVQTGMYYSDATIPRQWGEARMTQTTKQGT